MDFQKICDTLKSHPEVADTFTHTDVVKYIELIGLLKPTPALTYLQPSYQISVPPPTLPGNVHEFLRASFQVDDETAKLAWEIFREIAWAFKPGPEEQRANRIKHVKLFLLYGVEQRIGVYSLCPPTRICLDPECRRPLHSDPSVFRDRELVEPTDYPVTLFTLDLGAVPGYSTSCYCRNCHTRYYPNYYVHAQATTRTYYLQDDIPEFIHSAEHFYTSADLCELFANMMATAWTSGTNCARIYNTSISKHVLEPLMPTDWLSLQMDVDNVYNSFFLHALLLDHHERDAIFELEHNAPSQAERLRPALEARNIRMAGPGQEEWNHFCDLCCYIYQDENERWVSLRSNITDGTTMGHYSCTALKKQCCVTTCTTAAQVGFRTCGLTDHRNTELYHYQRGKAMFQLKARLQRAKGSTPSSAFPPAEVSVPSPSRLPAAQRETSASGSDLLPASDGEDFADGDDEETEYVCDEKSSQGNRTIRAFFGRRSTHNEQLSCYSCGIVAGRATFFGSEAPNAVREFWMKLFPTKASLPGVLWHNNNCSIVKMLRNDTDEYLRTYFADVALPVDVFHFKSKHKEADIDCGAHCNPYIWPELRTEDGKWRFNSSAAEQTNAWFGGFQSIVREMAVERYNFFLDEMIKRRNRTLVKELRRRGKAPGSIPREELLGDGLGMDVDADYYTDMPPLE
ncbi:hypothetical protein C8F04DRAFT_1257200 [Mycena alexandri]|uniref:CxC5 like cysteine cluster associated with KDZ domain-containing protein n=1 Tax=Mycena alexandri TaxID=1745969 RepID=A0AAD6X5F8_9AGAR|nr:hypothetical protein C8F04DRAFT_1257200 [Mycena alexandri]